MTNSVKEFEPAMTGAAPRRRRQPVTEHWCWLIFSSAIIAASFCLEVRGAQQVGTAFGPDFVLPTMCLYRGVLGINCPGCGLTRSFIYLAHGDWRASWDVHHLGWLIALVVVWQVPYRIYRLSRPARATIRATFIHWFAYGLIGIFLVNWLLTSTFSLLSN
jgi:hypothetical protein